MFGTSAAQCQEAKRNTTYSNRSSYIYPVFFFIYFAFKGLRFRQKPQALTCSPPRLAQRRRPYSGLSRHGSKRKNKTKKTEKNTYKRKKNPKNAYLYFTDNLLIVERPFFYEHRILIFFTGTKYRENLFSFFSCRAFSAEISQRRSLESS